MRIHAFKALRPKTELASQVAAVPYDVVNRDEASRLAEGNPHSFLRVGRSEIELSANTDPYSAQVYALAKTNLDKLLKSGAIFQESTPCLYVYRQTMSGREQYGLVACVDVKEYREGIIKKHELTRADKEDDRTRHVLATNAHSGPVFLTYRDAGQAALVAAHTQQAPVADFVAADGVGHTVWRIADQTAIDQLVQSFAKLPCSYIADGHHRSAAGARAADERAKANPSHKGTEEYNRFLAVLFPSTQLRIMDYNRVLRNLHGHSVPELLEALDAVMVVHPIDSMIAPTEPNSVHMYLQYQWYTCRFREQFLKDLGPVDSLDVALLQKLVLQPIFGIDDPRTSKVIDFVGGIRGLGELVKLVDSGSHAVAFAMVPTTLEQLMAIADAGEIMPPKSTWFEPKLRDGLLVHLLD